MVVHIYDHVLCVHVLEGHVEHARKGQADEIGQTIIIIAPQRRLSPDKGGSGTPSILIDTFVSPFAFADSPLLFGGKILSPQKPTYRRTFNI